MKWAITSLLCLLSLGVIGCSANSSWPSALKAAPSTPLPRDWLAEMKSIARVNHMHYVIFCTYWNSEPNQQFEALVCSGRCASGHGELIEEMTWVGGEGTTQLDAARDLVLTFNRNGFVKPKKQKAKKCCDLEHKICPPEIRGDEYTQEAK